MQANRDDRFTNDSSQRRGRAPVLVTVAALLLIAIIAWLVLRPEGEPETPATTVVPETPDPTPPRVAEPVAPDIPEQMPAAEPLPAEPNTPLPAEQDDTEPEPAAQQEPEEPPLTLANSDPEVRAALGDAAADGLARELLVNSNLLERGTAAIDAVRRGLVPDKVLNLPRPEGDFEVRRAGGRTLVDPASYRRYDPLVASLVATPVEPLAEAFRRFRPLLETAYGALGYAPDKVDNALIAALDRVIATPVIEEPLELESAGAVWAYARRDLEGMKALEKQLLRTGPENLKRLQTHARALRKALLEP